MVWLIVEFTGHFGAGKSAFASYMAVQQARRANAPLWANFYLDGATPIELMSDLYDCVGGVLVLDELQLTCGARTTQSGSNAQFLEWFWQARKQHSEVLIITQAGFQLDKVVRHLIDVEIECVSLGGDLTEVHVWDLRHRGCAKRIRQFVWDRRPAYGLYDTDQRAWALEPMPKSETSRGGSGARAPRLVAAV